MSTLTCNTRIGTDIDTHTGACCGLVTILQLHAFVVDACHEVGDRLERFRALPRPTLLGAIGRSSIQAGEGSDRRKRRRPARGKTAEMQLRRSRLTQRALGPL
jgi:hypothetical protein